MNTAHASFQSAFAAALFGPDAAVPGPVAALASQPAFAVYRNTVIKGCLDALEANFPTVARLVGSEWFRAAGAVYVAQRPPRDARLLRYGHDFADFLSAFEPARELPYLGGVACLDFGWCEAHAAADAETHAGLLAMLLPESLGAARVAPHPAARWHWFPDQPVYTIWSRNRTPAGPSDDDIAWQGEGVLLTRQDGAVTWCAADEADCAFLDACTGGTSLAEAAAAALAVQPDADLAQLLAKLLRAGALVVSPIPSESEQP